MDRPHPSPQQPRTLKSVLKGRQFFSSTAPVEDVKPQSFDAVDGLNVNLDGLHMDGFEGSLDFVDFGLGLGLGLDVDLNMEASTETDSSPSGSEDSNAAGFTQHYAPPNVIIQGVVSPEEVKALFRMYAPSLLPSSPFPSSSSSLVPPPAALAVPSPAA